MARFGFPRPSDLSRRIQKALSRLEVLALFPFLALSALWLGLDSLLVLTAVLLPALLALQAIGRASRGRKAGPKDLVLDGLTGLPMRSALDHQLTHIIRDHPGSHSAAILVHLDDLATVKTRWGQEGVEEILRRSADRLRATLRHDDLVARLGPAEFGIVLHAIRSARMDILMTLLRRLQAAIDEPIAIGGTTAHVTCSIGYCTLTQAPRREAAVVLAAAEAALTQARRNGPVAIRGFARGQTIPRDPPDGRATEIAAAFAQGAFRAWFQPQIATATGAITGFEALARWHHPKDGILPPAEFMEDVAAAGKLRDLGELMLYQALSALRQWDRAGVTIPMVAVNLSAEELRDPQLADRVAWEVDRFDLRPARLTIEILEDVAGTSDDDAVIHNITALGRYGFNLDLDDFGTGQASIANIRRFHVNRIKIDRSFVTNLDKDPSQQAMVSAILALADHLGVETLAEGVETLSEQAMLAQLGCGHIQGYGLARPMPFDKTTAWAKGYEAKRGMHRLPVTLHAGASR